MEEPIDKIIQNIINSYSEEVATQSKQIKPIQPTTENLAEIVIKKVDSNDAVAKEIYDLFYGELALGRDRSSSSKEALLRSLELKVESSKALVELAKALAKKDQSNANNVGVFVNTKSGDDFGINIKNIQDSDE